MIHTQDRTGEERREQRRRQRRDEIVDAAAAIVADEGLENLTAQKLAARTGSAVGAMYRYFAGVNDVVVELQNRALGELADLLDRAAHEADRRNRRQTPTVRALAKVVAACRAFGHLHQTAPQQHRLIDGMLSSPRPVLTPTELAAADAALLPVIGRVSGWIAAAASHGGLTPGDAVVRTHLLWASLHGIDHLRHRDRAVPVDLRTDALREAMLRDFLLGWGAATSDVADAMR